MEDKARVSQFTEENYIKLKQLLAQKKVTLELLDLIKLDYKKSVYAFGHGMIDMAALLDSRREFYSVKEKLLSNNASILISKALLLKSIGCLNKKSATTNIVEICSKEEFTGTY